MTPNGSAFPSSASESTSSSLLERVKARQPEAWERLVDLYSPLLYRWCRYSGLLPEDARDVVQDVFGAVAQSVDDFRGAQPRGSFRSWLRAITRRKVVDHFRNRRTGPAAKGGSEAQMDLLQIADSFDISSTSHSADLENLPWHQTLERVRAEFEARTWDAFWRMAVEGRSPAEVAQDLGMTLHAVYKAKSRVLRRARQELADLEGNV